MVVLTSALLSLLLPAAVLARPNQHERLHMKHKRHGDFSDIHPDGIHGGPPTNIYPHPTGTSGAPFPIGNTTTVAPTGTGTGASVPGGVVTISSVISIVPVPISSGQSVPAESQGGNGGSPTQPSGSGASGGPGGNGGSGSGSDQCGPATVTVTSAKTVTVTVPAAGAQSQGPAPVQSSPSSNESSSPVQPKPEAKAETKPESKPTTQPESKPEQKSTGNSSPIANTQPKPPTEQKQEKPASSPASKPETKPAEASTQNSSPIGSNNQQSPSKPQTEQKKEQPKVSQSAQPSPSSKPTEEKSSPSGGKRGILYKTLDEANGMKGMSWGCNWDSSPMPAVGHAQGSLDFEFVPQLWGPEDVHTSIWAANSQGAKYVMAFNEPNQPQGAGGCGPMDAIAAVGPYESNFKANKDAGQKIVSPCVSNEAHEWLDTFISATSLKPDAVCFHWYGQNKDELKGIVDTFKDLQSKHGVPELWLSEFAVNGGLAPSDMQDLLSYLESSGVDRYAYNAEKMAVQAGLKEAYQAIASLIGGN
ncbi:uncharacterized protein KY384_002528 [Bacidia gigantensis]|uniref:uncharacterized protein n=1 Tax=Bacidia gigantensis TaxID=2732470 RepID=UPI001D056341|nr:uncharacterized protein KY384_002528 [Bacidia gigantensis]KAG8532651.1 hypothetical protein KY384_002528 [Bacidia gigantensis]